MGRILAVLLVVSLTGCSYFQKKGIIKSGDASVAAVGDAGKPATLNTSDAKESLPIPAGSTITVRKTEAVPATETTAFQPAAEFTEVKLNGPTIWERKKNEVAANTGTVDTSVALNAQAIESKRPFLYCGIACAFAAIVSLGMGFKTPAALSGVASLTFLAMWKIADMPWWGWGIGVLCVGAAVGIHFGFFKGERDPLVKPAPVVVPVAPAVVVQPVAPTPTPPVQGGNSQ